MIGTHQRRRFLPLAIWLLLSTFGYATCASAGDKDNVLPTRSIISALDTTRPSSHDIVVLSRLSSSKMMNGEIADLDFSEGQSFSIKPYSFLRAQRWAFSFLFNPEKAASKRSLWAYPLNSLPRDAHFTDGMEVGMVYGEDLAQTCARSPTGLLSLGSGCTSFPDTSTDRWLVTSMPLARLSTEARFIGNSF